MIASDLCFLTNFLEMYDVRRVSLHGFQDPRELAKNRKSGAAEGVVVEAGRLRFLCVVEVSEPRMVMQFATTSKSRTGNSPGGNSTRTHVPCLRVMPIPRLNAISEGPAIRTP